MATRKNNPPMNPCPTSQNLDWGFWGTWSRRTRQTQLTTLNAWREAITALAAAGFTPEQARKVLDAAVGRHMADQVGSGGSITKTVERLAGDAGWRKEMNEAAGVVPPRKPRNERAIRLLKAAQEAVRELALEVENDDAEDLLCEAITRLEKVGALIR